MRKAIRTQADDLGDMYSMQTAVDASDSPDNRDTARQELKQEADINIMLAKFGVFAPQKQLFFGDVDYGLDLQQALGAIADAKSAWLLMPPEVKKEFRTWQELLNALESGQIKVTEGEAPIVTESLQTATVSPRREQQSNAAGLAP